MKKFLYGAIEAGRSQFVCTAADDCGNMLAETRIVTTTPVQTLAAVENFFVAQQDASHVYKAMGIASFGPVDLYRGSSGFGCIMATPKAGWSHANLSKSLAQRFDCPVVIDTDINGAALGEALHGAGRGCDFVVYINVGCGIVSGMSIRGRTLQSSIRPEISHISVVKHDDDLGFTGVCPFHDNCVQGLVSGPAITMRFGATLNELPAHHIAWDIVPHYLGQLAAATILLLSPQRLIFGGGVMNNLDLLPKVRAKTASLLKGYAGLDASPEALTDLITSPGLGHRAYIVGAMELARSAADLVPCR